MRRAVALVVRRVSETSDEILAVRRPPDDKDELGDLWGLPAATLNLEETEEAGVFRLARAKLGTDAIQLRLLRRGRQRRPLSPLGTGSRYTLAMALYETRLKGPVLLPEPSDWQTGITYYTEWRWLPALDLTEAAERGSLCARLLLADLGRVT